jgi:uncharacterized phage-associated protein
MSKIIVLKGGQAEFIMANMSATILREIVGRILNVKATQVKLSGEMDINFVEGDCSTSGNLYSNDNTVLCWAFEPKQGLVYVPTIKTGGSSSNANGSWEQDYGVTAEYLNDNYPDALFFVIRHYGSYSDCNGRDEEYDNITLYKSPDFTTHYAKIEQEDIARWEQWLSE